MTRALAILLAASFCLLQLPALAVEGTISRRDGFLLLWQSIGRPAQETREKPFPDVSLGARGFAEITYAKARGLLDDEELFRPDEPLASFDALLWLFRTRNVEPLDDSGARLLMTIPDPKHVAALAEHYGLEANLEGASLTRDGLLAFMKTLDTALQSEEHEVSLYSEKFHEHGTAFGEMFDMNALTAAHRTFPHNTLVRVTNVENGKSVVVRINDRGPFVAGRDMDLSLGAFTTIAERSRGKIQATFERLGDASLTMICGAERFQRRLGKGALLDPGIPHSFALGQRLSLSSKEAFVVRDVLYPDGASLGQQTWITKGETFDFTPSATGVYQFRIGTISGRARTMKMEVVDCRNPNT